MIKEVKIKKITDFELFIASLEVNVRYLLPDNFRYKWVRIAKESEYYSKNIYFTWAMEYNYSVAGMVGYIYPISSGNKVTHFKTEKGAKRNFIKRYAEIFKQEMLIHI